MKEYFDISIYDLQNATKWVFEYSIKAIGIYETRIPDDQRPRKAIEGAKEFIINGKRTNTLRKLAVDAYRSSIETMDIVASYAARASSLTAAVAFTHPYRDIKQAEHILGPVVYSALALEILLGNEEKGDEILANAIADANKGIALLLIEYPKHNNKNTRIERLYYRLDIGIRSKFGYEDNFKRQES